MWHKMPALLFLLDLPVVANKRRHYLLLPMSFALAWLGWSVCAIAQAAPAAVRPVVNASPAAGPAPLPLAAPATTGAAAPGNAAAGGATNSAVLPVRAMSKNEVYELLQAELLLRRGDSAEGFRKYLALARSTRDPGVVAFAV